MIPSITGLSLEIFFYSLQPEENELWIHTKFNHLLKALSSLSNSAVLKKLEHFCSFDGADRVLRQSGSGRTKLCGKRKVATILNDG